MNTEELMMLADAYAQEVKDFGHIDGSPARAALEAALSAKQGEQDALLDSTVPPHALYYPLSDYHRAPAEGPLNFTWIDKPHRLLYDLIAAVKFYANPAPEAKQEPTCKQDLQVPTVKECLTVQCWVTKSGQFSFEPQDERYWTRMVPAPSVNAQERISELERKNAQLLEALKHIEELSVCGWSAGIARATIAAVEGKTK